MPLIRHAGKIAFFIHIPKTGGTSIETSLMDAGAKVALLYGSRFNGYCKTTFQHMNADIYEKVVPPAFYDYSFAIVRHPFSRLVSEYYYRQKRGFSVDSFDRWVNNAIDQYPKNPYSMDNHFRPQVDFIRSGVAVFKMEDGLDLPLQAAANQLGLPVPIQAVHVNKGELKKPVRWSRKTRARAAEFYKDDFDTFGYDAGAKFPELSLTFF